MEIRYGRLLQKVRVCMNSYTFEYKSMERIPNRIMLVAAASQFGDYFQGSTGSVMWLDDLELIYEEVNYLKI